MVLFRGHIIVIRIYDDIAEIIIFSTTIISVTTHYLINNIYIFSNIGFLVYKYLFYIL